MNKLSWLSLVILIGYVLMSALALLGLVGTEFATTSEQAVYHAPSLQHWFGTDIFGRDVLARAIHGTVTAFLVGIFSSLIALVVGLTLGSLAGFFRGWVDDVVVWLYTTLDSIPYILLLASFAFALGQGLVNMYLALGLTSWVTLCRLVRGEIFKLRGQEYMVATTALGYGSLRKIVHHLWPNIFPIVVVQTSLNFIAAIKIEVILSYLGLGVEPGTPSWGMMIDDSQLELTRGIWWNFGAATLFMFGLILSSSLLIEALRRRFDPKSRIL